MARVSATWAQLKLIRSAELQIRVADVRKTIAAADVLAQGGEALLGDVTTEHSTTEDVSKAYADLETRLVVKDEEMKGARRFYDQRVATSTISVSVVELGARLRPSLGAPIGAAMRQSLEVLAKSVAMVIDVITFLVPWVLLAALAWWAIRRWRARPFVA